MTLSALSALAFALICAGVVSFQIALIAGAPWGRLTQGGGTEGALPVRGRVAAGMSGLLLAAMALAILSAAGMWPNWPVWTGWAAVALQAVSTILNWITRSTAERRLWGPTTTVMLVLASTTVLSA